MLSIERSDGARIVALVAAVGIGALATVAPLPVVAATVATVGLVWLLARGRGVIQVFEIGLAAILVGYAFFNRAFAYVGVSPIFVGEVVLAIGILALVYSRRRWKLTPVATIMLLFMLWGLIRTVPYLPTDGVNALRDAVAWIYAAFALIVATVVVPDRFPAIVRLTRRVIPYLLVWIPISSLAVIALGASVPLIPGTTVPLLPSKTGDLGVMLAGIAAFILVGLYALAETRPRLPEPLPWVLWVGGVGVVAIINRGAMVAMATIIVALVFVRQSSRWLSLVFVITLIFVTGLLLNPRIDLGGRREFSFNQLSENVTSIFAPTNDPLQGTKNFRLAWWGAIVNYTVNGPYFWTGKGYGIALAEADGFNKTEAEDLRSPHNAHMEVLARTGVPGLTLWVLLQIAIAVMMWRAASRARADGRRFWVQVIAWLCVLWLAALANATFDPYLQGPQGGIWFWSVIGLAMAASRAVQEGVPDPWPESQARRMADG